ncbi:MAG: glycoside hydrolase family 32 protein [Candidatus Nanopelagicales bacterium]
MSKTETPAIEDQDSFDATLRARAAQAVVDRPEAVDADPWRQTFHIQPPVGLLNDPNGLVQHEGVYHFCYQWNPFGPVHASKFWAHVTSTDLVHWSDPSVALAPSDPLDKDGCYSGSGLVADAVVRFFYTGNVRGPAGERWAYQNLAAIGPDGAVVKHRDNPLVPPLDGYSGHIRDPKVWSTEGAYWMLLGAQTQDLHGTALLLRSPDLHEWELLGEIGGGASEPLGYMWECPDIIRLTGGEILMISPQFDEGPQAGTERHSDVTLYNPGVLDLTTGRFTGTDFRQVDAGPDFYAPQSFTDDSGRTIMVGWMGKPDHDEQPLLAVKHPSAHNGWVHCLTVPRTLRLEGDRLIQWPVEELEVLRGEPTTVVGATVEPGASLDVAGPSGAACDLELSAACAPGGTLTLRLRQGASGRPVLVTIDHWSGTVALDRTLLGTGEGGVHTGSFEPGDRANARILLDNSSIEVFINGGRLALSARIYPVPDDTQILVDADGAPLTLDLSCYPLRGGSAPWPESPTAT